MGEITCRFCGTVLNDSFVDLGMSPLSNALISVDAVRNMEPFYPLHARICSKCLLVQLPEVESSENIFSDYVYFSSFSESWLEHSEKYVEKMVQRFGYNEKKLVIEIASNDGYLLQFFQKKSIPVLGIEPAENVAEEAIKSGIPTVIKFFGESLAGELAARGQFADLLIGNNVLAHVPDLNDFVRGMKTILKADGVITMEFPHLMRLIEKNQFDTIYHEHFSYFSFSTVKKIFEYHGMSIFDVDELSTHGGSLRIYACHNEDKRKIISTAVKQLEEKERIAGLHALDTYLPFKDRVIALKQSILLFLIELKRENKSIVGYGAPAKGNTLLNYCGIRTDFIEYTVDRSPHKQNHLSPGTHIPIYHPDKIKASKPDYLVILPWNLREEIMEQMAYIREWGGRFVTLVPEVRTYQ